MSDEMADRARKMRAEFDAFDAEVKAKMRAAGAEPPAHEWRGPGALPTADELAGVHAELDALFALEPDAPVPYALTALGAGE